MPVLEDTVDFKVATLNDLLDADVKKGVPVAADDKYKRWAFLSTGLAGMLLIALIVSLVTGGGDDSGVEKSSKTVAAPANSTPVDVGVGATLPSGIELGAAVSLLDSNGQVVSGGGLVTQIRDVKPQYGKGLIKQVVVHVPNDDIDAVNAAKAASGGKLGIQPGARAKATTTTTAAPSTTPTPIEPAPATTPSS